MQNYFLRKNVYFFLSWAKIFEPCSISLQISSRMDRVFMHRPQCYLFRIFIYIATLNRVVRTICISVRIQWKCKVQTAKKDITIKWYIAHIMNLIRNEQLGIICGNEKFSVNLKFIVECSNDIMATFSIWQLIKKKYSQFHSIWLFI